MEKTFIITNAKGQYVAQYDSLITLSYSEASQYDETSADAMVAKLKKMGIPTYKVEYID